MEQEEELSEQVLWLQVWGLAGLQGAIALTCLIYSVYLPQLLAEFNFPAQVGIALIIVENGLAVLLEPLMGGLSDRDKRQFGSRFPLIAAGIVLASTFFIAIPTAVVFGKGIGEFRWILVTVSVAWALAMTVFRSPVITLLRNYAPPEGLVLANSLLVLVAGLFTAFKPIARSWSVNLGAVFAFAMGAFALLGAAAILRYVNLPETLARANLTATAIEQKTPKNPPLHIALSLIFLIGMAIAWGTQFAIATLYQTLMLQTGMDNVDWLMVGVGIVLALAAPPTADWALRIDNQRAMFAGAIATAMLLQIAVFIPNWLTLVITMLGLLIAFNLVLNGAIPLVLMLVAPHQAGIGAGMYFSGMAAAESLLGFLLPLEQSITPHVGAIGGAGAFLLLSACVAVSIKWRSLYSL
jgi:Na+/melibiose symporter-like transporter